MVYVIQTKITDPVKRKAFLEQHDCANTDLELFIGHVDSSSEVCFGSRRSSFRRIYIEAKRILANAR